MSAMSAMHINTCDISVFIGKSKYDIVTPFERLWKNNDWDNYKRLSETLSEESQDLLLSKKAKIEKYLPKSNSVLVGSSENSSTPDEKKKFLFTELSKSDLSVEKKQELTECINSVVNTNHGIKNEAKVIDIVSKKHHISIDTNNKLYKKEIVPNVLIVGRVDGLCDDFIIEVKNRMNGFFDKVRDYEMTQVQIYMWLLDNIKYVLLEEHYNDKVKSTQIFKDQEYIDDILESLKGFIANFQKFLVSEKIKLEYLNKNSFAKAVYIRSLIESGKSGFKDGSNIVCSIVD